MYFGNGHSRRRSIVFLTHISFSLQAPKEQKSKEAKAIAAANSSKGKKKVRGDFNRVGGGTSRVESADCLDWQR